MDKSESKTRIPRCWFARPFDPSALPLKDVRVRVLYFVLNQPRYETKVFELSLTGLAVARFDIGMRSPLRRGQTVKVQIPMNEGLEWGPEMSLKVSEFDDTMAYGYFDSIHMQERLQVPQDLKDQVIGANLMRLSTEKLELAYQSSHWFHGPFDTNFLITSAGSGLLEYDGTLLKWNSMGAQIFHCASIMNPKGLAPVGPSSSILQQDTYYAKYSSGWTEPSPLKVTVGPSWWDRWIKISSQISESENTKLFPQPLVRELFVEAQKRLQELRRELG